MAYISDKIRMRWPILCSQALIGIVGLLVILYAKPAGVRYFGLYLAIFGCQANIPGTLAYGNNQTERTEKKGVVAASMIFFGAAGGKFKSFRYLSNIAMLSFHRQHHIQSTGCTLISTRDVVNYRYVNAVHRDYSQLVHALLKAEQVS